MLSCSLTPVLGQQNSNTVEHLPFQMLDFRIPRLTTVAARAQSAIKGRSSGKSILRGPAAAAVGHCRSCRMEHNLNSYCSRSTMSRRSSGSRKTNRGRRSRSPSSSSASASEEGEVFSAGGDGYSEDPSGSEDGEVVDKATGEKVEEEDPLQDFFSGQKRIDAKETTLTLLPSTLKHYFSTVMKEGELSKEGREELAEKYYLSPEQYEKLKPPRLDDTKLFRLGDKEFKVSRAGRLIVIHSKARDATKLSLALLEKVGFLCKENSEYESTPIYDEEGRHLEQFQVRNTPQNCYNDLMLSIGQVHGCHAQRAGEE